MCVCVLGGGGEAGGREAEGSDNRQKAANEVFFGTNSLFTVVVKILF